LSTVDRYYVRKGETLSAIAQKLGVSINSVMSVNRIKNRHKLREGLQLRIPGKGNKKHGNKRISFLNQTASPPGCLFHFLKDFTIVFYW